MKRGRSTEATTGTVTFWGETPQAEISAVKKVTARILVGRLKVRWIMVGLLILWLDIILR
jgi:hypothetical protein